MLFWFMCSIGCVTQQFKAKLHDKVSVITSIGVVKNASFEIIFKMHDAFNISAFMVSKTKKDMIIFQPNDTCVSDDEELSQYYVNFKRKKYVWKGNFDEEGTFYLLVFNRWLNHTEINIETRFKNGDSYLDTRDRFLSFVYQNFSIIYFVFAIIWISNGYFNSNFRIPLHTIFTFLPIIRSTSLFISRSIWLQKQQFDFVSPWKSITTLFLEICYYGLFFTGIALACYGFCTYRNKFKRKDRIEILLSSISLSGGMIFFSRVRTFKEALIGLFSICFCFMWYIKNSFVYLIITSNLLKKMKKDKIICAKIKLSRNCVSISLWLFLLTIIVSCFVAGIELREAISVIVFEIGLILNSLVQMYFFLFRKRYSGNVCECPKKVEIRRFALLKEPKAKSYLCCLYERVN